MKIVIGIPHTGSVKAQTLASVVDLVGATTHPLALATQAGCYVHENRTKLVRAAQQAGATHLFFLDSDIACPGDTIERLLAHDKPVVGAMYNSREWPRVHTVKLKGPDGYLNTAADGLPQELFPCYAVPTGCLLVEMSVFHGTPLPWFGFEENERGELTMGEDVWFCDRAAKHGYDVWCDPTIPVRHIGDFAY